MSVLDVVAPFFVDGKHIKLYSGGIVKMIYFCEKYLIYDKCHAAIMVIS